MLPDRPSANALRAILDQFDIGGRLLHIRDFIWRGGGLELRTGAGDTLACRGRRLWCWETATGKELASPAGPERPVACFGLSAWGQLLAVEIRTDGVTYNLEQGEGLTVYHRDEPLDLRPGEPVRRP